MPDLKGKPYDFEVAKALQDLNAAHQVLLKADFNLAITIGRHEPIAIPVPPEVFAGISCAKLQVEPLGKTGGAYKVHKVLSDGFSICTAATSQDAPQEAEERKAA